MIFYPIYEDGNIFLNYSYGFCPGRGAHQALDAVTVAIERLKVSWVLDCDIRKFFDNVDHEKLIKLIEMRMEDKRVIRLILEWLKAGVMVGDKKEHRKVGVPQGPVISPVLANIYLHYALIYGLVGGVSAAHEVRCTSSGALMRLWLSIKEMLLLS